LKKTLLIGLGMFAIVYAGMAMKTDFLVYIILFTCYGVYSASAESISKAWISNIAAKEDTATAIGFFSGFQSIALLLASSLAGILWYSFGPSYTFLLSAIVALG
jgi:MFS family permease